MNYRVVLIGLLLCTAPSVRADTLLVPEDYSIDDALAAAVTGDEISVAPGTLDGESISLPDGIALRSREPYANQLKLIEIHGATNGVEVHGFRISDDVPGEPELEGAKISDSMVRFEDCAFTGIHSSPEGVFNDSELLLPIACRVDSDVEFVRCTFSANATGGFNHGDASPAHNVVSYGYGVPKTGSLYFEQCQFDGQVSPIMAQVPLTVVDSTFLRCPDYMVYSFDTLELRGNVFVNYVQGGIIDCAFAECYGYTKGITAYGDVTIENNTFVDSEYLKQPFCDCPYPSDEEIGALITLKNDATGSITNNLFIDQPGAAVEAPAGVIVACNDAFQSGTQNWIGGIGDVTGSDGNISQAPLLCNRSGGDYTLAEQSPAAPEHSGCGLMGAMPVACEESIPTVKTSFGALKEWFGGEQ